MTTSSAAWPVEHQIGGARRFHARSLPDPVQPELWWFEVDGPTVVLGSTQDLSVVDEAAASAAGVEVARRRSGGGAVWLAPGSATWIDVILPAEDPRWSDDISRSAVWLGRVWERTLGRLGVEGARTHEGPMVRTDHDRLVCFAGLAPGEVTVAGAKVLGLSQRRARAGARFQCAVLHEWDPSPLVEVLAMDAGARTHLREDLASVATGIGPVDAAGLIEALRAELLATG